MQLLRKGGAGAAWPGNGVRHTISCTAVCCSCCRHAAVYLLHSRNSKFRNRSCNPDYRQLRCLDKSAFFTPQVHYLERVNAELHGLLEKSDGEAFSAQAALEADKKGALKHIRSLQDEMGRLHERVAALAADREALDARIEGA